MAKRLITVLRIHRRHQAHPKADAHHLLPKLVASTKRAAAFSKTVIIVFDGADPGLTEAIKGDEQLVAFERLAVQPWGFTVPLNSALVRAQALGASHIAFCSLEVTVDPHQIDRMFGMFTAHTLVVGMAMREHKFHDEGGVHNLTGLSSPWNTCAIWDLAKLGKTGFLAVSDTHVAPGQSSIEEVPTIALHQRLFAETSDAILVKFCEDQNRWETTWEDPGRMKWQASKMASKNSSAASQLSALALASAYGDKALHAYPVVRHVTFN